MSKFLQGNSLKRKKPNKPTGKSHYTPAEFFFLFFFFFLAVNPKIKSVFQYFLFCISNTEEQPPEQLG